VSRDATPLHAVNGQRWVWLSSRLDSHSRQTGAIAIDERMKQLGRSARYLKELSKITKEKNLPSE
jgi:hypothetical protein